jgi:signal transduction histidine kinase
MKIDIGTTILLLGFMSLVLVLVLLYLYLVNKTYKIILWWFLWASAQLLGLLCMLLPDFPGGRQTIMMVQNLMFILSAVFLYIGIARFMESKVNFRLTMAILTAFILTFAYFLFIHEIFQVRVIIFSITIAAFALMTLLALNWSYTIYPKYSLYLLAAVITSHGVLFLFRAAWVIRGDFATNVFETNLFNFITLFDGLVLSILMAVSFIIMLHQRGHKDLLDARKEIESREARFRVLIENMNEGVAIHQMIYNEKGEAVNYRIVEVNRAYESILGIMKNHAAGELATELYRTDKAPYLDEYASVVSNLNPIFFETFFERKNQYFSISAVPVSNEYFATIFLDITQNKTLKEKLERSLAISERSREILLSILEDQKMIQQSLEDSNALLSLFIKHSPIYAYIKEVKPDKSRVLKASDNFIDMIGIPASEMNGKTMQELFPPDFAKTMTDDDWHVVSQNAILRQDEFLNGRSYTTIKFPIFMGSRSLLAGYSIDITDRISAEKEIKKLNETLERRITLRTAQLEASNEELEAFSYSVSHDLRAPLRHINGYISLFLENYYDHVPEKGQHYLKSILLAVRQMGNLIDDLLLFSRIGRQEMNMELVDMNAVLQEALTALEPDTNGRKIEWSVKDLPEVTGDPKLLRQVWINLISNAVKFTQKQQTARIKIGYKKTPDEFEFYISDNGVGLDMKYAQKLFGVFQRFHPADEFEGTGIGLANVKRIVNKHGGRVWAEATVGKGAQFYFSLMKPYVTK